MTQNTERLYNAAQLAFLAWCKAQAVPLPPSHETVARYLRHCLDIRGPSSVRVHLAAIAALVRATGGGLDTKHPTISAVLAEGRQMDAARSAQRQRVTARNTARLLAR